MTFNSPFVFGIICMSCALATKSALHAGEIKRGLCASLSRMPAVSKNPRIVARHVCCRLCKRCRSPLSSSIDWKSIIPMPKYYQLFLISGHNCKSLRNGKYFQGSIDFALGKIPCVEWGTKWDEYDFPDETSEDLGHKCRNPNSDSGGPWCFTDAKFEEFNYCDVDYCGE